VNDQPIDIANSQALVEEIGRLRGDIARLEQRLEDLDRLAHHDSLVPLPNRRGFTRQLERTIARTNRYGDKSALLFVDVDGLKMINDSFGHHAGDAALIHVAGLLLAGVRGSDFVARFGGDEFAVVLEHADEEQAVETAGRLANSIADTNLVHDEQAIPVSAAIGVTTIMPGDTPESVLLRADRAMYDEKSAAA
jgi:diguanylate cyclase (GGDEF)-like protein